MDPSRPILRIALPKGRLESSVCTLLGEAGIHVLASSRAYRPELSVPGFEAKLLKPRNIVEMLQAGSRDIGFAGADWVAELDGALVSVLDTRMDPVRIVAAAPPELLVDGRLPDRPLVIASEYGRLTERWIEASGLDARVLRSAGATEVFPPEDADVIVDNVSTGSTLRANGLVILDEVMTSTTHLYANRAVYEDPARREALDELVLLLSAVLESRLRVMLELNVPKEQLDAIVEALPCMRLPTVAALADDSGYGVKAAVLRKDLPRLIPALKAQGGCDIVVTPASQIVP
jgi:ATP phosphoribosyltransferase